MFNRTRLLSLLPAWLLTTLLVGLCAQALVAARHVTRRLGSEYPILIELERGATIAQAEELMEQIRESSWNRRLRQLELVPSQEIAGWLAAQQPELNGEVEASWIDLPKIIEAAFFDPVVRPADVTGFEYYLKDQPLVKLVSHDAEGLELLRSARKELESGLLKGLCVLWLIGLCVNFAVAWLSPPDAPLAPVRHPLFKKPYQLAGVMLLVCLAAWLATIGLMAFVWPSVIDPPDFFSLLAPLILAGYGLSNAALFAVACKLLYR
ncbi:hypothetical protein JXA32_11555 [Candidatus Sumerlaeota bacterium]|nr:hypothetical protein [Candidatus Sumerlaeota bacterium]